MILRSCCTFLKCFSIYGLYFSIFNSSIESKCSFSSNDTPAFFNADKYSGSLIPLSFNKLLLKLNPAAYVIDEFRSIFLYGEAPSLIMLGGWFIAGCLITMLGIHIIHKYENSYAKVI